MDVEDAGGVLGPLDVAADPVERLGDAAQHRDLAVLLLLLLLLLGILLRRRSELRGPPTGIAGRRRRCAVRSGDGLAPAWHRRPASTHVSFEPPPWLEFTTRLPSRQGHPGQPAGHHPHVAAVVHRERPQVDVAGPRRPSTWVGDVDSATTSWAIQPRGLASTSLPARRPARLRSPAGRSRARSRRSRRPA